MFENLFSPLADWGLLVLRLALGTTLIVHGWMYVVYLFADFRLWSLMRWPFSRFITIALGGVIPFLSFFTERTVHAEVDAELAAHPTAAKRY